jgi:uncharacterized membrane protein YkoI
MKPLAIPFLIAALAFAAHAADKKVELKDLPPAVQKTVAEQTKNAELKGLGIETEKGVKSYEIETIANGKHRDLSVDAKGNVTSVEEETAIDSIPAPAKAAILKKVATGKLGMVETVTQGSKVLYEAQFTTKAGKKTEVLVKADGTPTKD